MKRLVVFDLDGTLAESKAAVDAEMAGLLAALSAIVHVAVISGGAWPQFERQFIGALPATLNWRNLSLLPTCGTQFYTYDQGWRRLYAEELTSEQKDKISAALRSSFSDAGFPVDEVWGEQIEDRGTQITFSALGQQAPLDAKKRWDPDFEKRRKIAGLLHERIPEFSIRLGGATSIDVTRAGVDKSYGIAKLREILRIGEDDMLFVGDALFPGGNDYPVKEAGVDSLAVRDVAETKTIIAAILFWQPPPRNVVDLGKARQHVGNVD